MIKIERNFLIYKINKIIIFIIFDMDKMLKKYICILQYIFSIFYINSSPYFIQNYNNYKPMNYTDIGEQKKISQNHYFWGNEKKIWFLYFFVFYVYFKMRQNTKPNTLITTFHIFFFLQYKNLTKFTYFLLPQQQSIDMSV